MLALNEKKGNFNHNENDSQGSSRNRRTQKHSVRRAQGGSLGTEAGGRELQDQAPESSRPRRRGAAWRSVGCGLCG